MQYFWPSTVFGFFTLMCFPYKLQGALFFFACHILQENSHFCAHRAGDCHRVFIAFFCDSANFTIGVVGSDPFWIPRITPQRGDPWSWLSRLRLPKTTNPQGHLRPGWLDMGGRMVPFFRGSRGNVRFLCLNHSRALDFFLSNPNKV